METILDCLLKNRRIEFFFYNLLKKQYIHSWESV